MCQKYLENGMFCWIRLLGLWCPEIARSITWWTKWQIVYRLHFQLYFLEHECSGFNHWRVIFPVLQWRHNVRDGVSNHRRLDFLLNRLFGHRSMKTSKLRVMAFVRGIHRWTVNSPHKGPVTRTFFHWMTSLCWGHKSAHLVQLIYFCVLWNVKWFSLMAVDHFLVW